MNIIFLGPPGSGKGTQAEKISRDYAIPQISTGNILRHAIENDTELGRQAKKYMSAGDLVPDELIDKVVAERLSYRDCNKGFILDGFPRDLEQAEALEDIRAIEYVFEIYVPDQVLVKRLSQRRSCTSCGKTYHLTNKKPEKEGVCDNCGNPLIQREDDNPETIMNRLKVYHEQTEPLREYYNKENLLIPLDGTKPLNDLYAEIKKSLEP